MKCKDCYARNDEETCLIGKKSRMLVCGHYGCDLQKRAVEKMMGIEKPQTNADVHPNNELKPCPFCGGEANFEQTTYGTTDHDSVSLRFSIRCKNCGASAPNAYGYIAIKLSSNGELNIWHNDRNPAIAAWNRRAEDE